MTDRPPAPAAPPRARPAVDLLQISLGTTRGLRISDAWFAALAEQAGASVQTVGVRVGATGGLRRAYPVIDLVEALAARRAAATALARVRPRAVVFSTTTAALLAPDPGRPYAVRLDAPAALNRPGLRNAPVHLLERRRLAGAALVLPWSRVAAAALPPGSAPALLVPPPVLVAGGADGPRERLAVGYTPDPKAKGLDLLCRAWAQAVLPGVRLEVFGVDRARALRHLRRTGIPEPPGVIWRGWRPPQEFHAALARAQVFVASARWEDFGMAQLEALALGALLVCTATEGGFEARALARELAPELVAGDQSPEALAVCLERAFAAEEPGAAAYRAAARARLVSYGPDAIARRIRHDVLPTLLGG